MQNIQAHMAELIRARRKALGMKQDKLSELSGVALRTIRDLEKGLGNPSLNTITNVFNILGIQMNISLKEHV
jgi:y4mF family transcriptional regulator